MPSETLREHNMLLDETAVRDFVDSQGGVGALAAKMDEFREVVDRMRKERARLMEEYPDHWVAMGKDGVVVVGNSLENVLEKADARDMDRGRLVVEFLETDPPLMLL